MFSSRLPFSLAPNRLAEALARRRRKGADFIDLTESNPTRAGFDYPAGLLAPLAGAASLAYDPHPLGSPDARRAVAADYARRGVAVTADRIALTASTSEAYSLLFKLVADPGDEVLVPRPSYPLFEHLTRLDALVPRPYDLEYQGRWAIDWASVEAALTPRTRAVLIVSPNNPTGSFVSPAELDRLSAMAAAHEAALIADEVFADYDLRPGAAAAAGRVLDRRDGLAFALGGLSKTLGLPQVKLGWMALAGADALVAAARDRLELICDTYLSVSTPVQAAAADLLRRGADRRARIQARVAANYQRLRGLVGAAPACSVLDAEGGWYAVLQVPALAPEEDLVLALLEEDGVLVHPGYFFDFPREAFLVVSLIVPPARLEAGVARVLRHFACTAGSASDASR